MEKPTQSSRNILLSPLEWGLGHATRLSSIVEELLNDNHMVIIAADGLPYNFLQKRFPQLIIERVPLKQIVYAQSKRGFFFKLMAQMPAFFRSIKNTQRTIDLLVKKYNIDLIISDNRYGFIHPDIPSVFITHQLRPMPPKPWRCCQSIFGYFHLWLLRKYQFIWVADFEGEENVVGKLSRIPWKNKRIRHIGPQSWLRKFETNLENKPPEYDILVMLSGPEPHRTELEKKLLSILRDLPDKKIIVLQGLPESKSESPLDDSKGSIRIVNHLPGEQITELIKNTPTIICRAGVVTVFDLSVLQRPALLIPTPGQTEQEYVAEYLDKKGYFSYIDQSRLSLEKIIDYENSHHKTFANSSVEPFRKALDEFIRLA